MNAQSITNRAANPQEDLSVIKCWFECNILILSVMHAGSLICAPPPPSFFYFIYSFNKFLYNSHFLFNSTFCMLWYHTTRMKSECDVLLILLQYNLPLTFSQSDEFSSVQSYLPLH